MPRQEGGRDGDGREVVLRRIRWLRVAASVAAVLLGLQVGSVLLGSAALPLLLAAMVHEQSRPPLADVAVVFDLVAASLAAVALTPVGGAAPWILLAPVVLEAALQRSLLGAAAVWLGGFAGLAAVTRPALDAFVVAVFIAGSLLVVTAGLTVELLRRRLGDLRRVSEQTRHRAEAMSAVAEAARSVTTLDRDGVLNAVTSASLKLGFEMAEIVRVDRDRSRLVPVVQRGWPARHPPSPQSLEAGIEGRALTTGKTVAVADYLSWEYAIAEHVQAGIARAAIAAPIVVQGRTEAVLAVADPDPRPISDYERECLDLLASQAGVALGNARRFDETLTAQQALEHDARHDPLTGLVNRTALLEHIQTLLRTEADDPTAVGVLFLDLDDFKPVNDRLGHQAGDAALRIVADRLRRGVRPADVVGRYGGDEFVVVVDDPETNLSALCRRLADRITGPIHLETNTIEIDVSIGAVHGRAREDAQGLIARADDEMYRAKDAPRGPRFRS